MTVAKSQDPRTRTDHTQLPESDRTFAKYAWWDSEGNLFLSAKERAEQDKLRAERLAAKLRELGVDPDEI